MAVQDAQQANTLLVTFVEHDVRRRNVGTYACAEFWPESCRARKSQERASNGPANLVDNFTRVVNVNGVALSAVLS